MSGFSARAKLRIYAVVLECIQTALKRRRPQGIESASLSDGTQKYLVDNYLALGFYVGTLATRNSKDRLGPYKTKQGYIWFSVRDPTTGDRKAVFEHREIMANVLGRSLTKEEQVHHKDHNPANNHPDNLVVLTRAEHDLLHPKTPAELLDLVCVGCKKEFKGLARQYRANQLKQGKFGPFCGKSCAGRWGANKDVYPRNRGLL